MTGQTKEAVKSHECPICQKKFKYKPKLNQHMTVHTGEKNHICKICKKGYQQKWNLVTHVQRVHSKIHPFKCTQCMKTFGYSSHFKKHVKKHLLEKIQLSDEVKTIILKPYCCSICSKNFETNAKLKLHMNSHDEHTTYVCEKCGRSFKSKYTISDHIKNVHDDNTDGYMCDKCGVVFTSKKSIILHFKKGHSTVPATNRTKQASQDDKVTPCEVCGKIITKVYMRNHLNTHYKSRIYPCSYCGKKFLEYGNRRNHERIHTGEKPYECDVCGKQHRQLGNLITHRKTVHHLYDKVKQLTVARKEKKSSRVYNHNTSSTTRRTNHVKINKPEFDYVTELKKVQEFVGQEETEADQLNTPDDHIKRFLSLTNKWANKQFQQSKQKTDKRKGREDKTIKQVADVDDDDNNNDDCSDSDDDQIPLAQLLNLQPNEHIMSSDMVKVKLEVQDTTSDDDDDDDGGLADDNKNDENNKNYLDDVLDQLSGFRYKMNCLIYQELVKILDKILDGEELKKFDKVKNYINKNMDKNKPLAILFRKYKVPDNTIYKRINNREVWTCWMCESIFKTRYTLCRHLIVHQPPEQNPFKCNSCDKVFTQLDNLKEHLMVHNDSHRYCCEICGAGFRHKTNFSIHLNRHGVINYEPNTNLRNKKYKCSYCDKMCYSRFHMTEHERIHSDLSPYMCTLCGKSYRTKCALNRHSKGHSNVKDHHCAICYRPFSTKYQVNRHMVTHTGEKKFVCECSKTFTQKSSLTKHKKYCENNTQPSVKPHSCTHCDKSFYVRHDLERHKLTHDPAKRHQCNICHTMLKTALNLRRHMNRHTRDKNIRHHTVVNILRNNTFDVLKHALIHTS